MLLSRPSVAVFCFLEVVGRFTFIRLLFLCIFFRWLRYDRILWLVRVFYISFPWILLVLNLNLSFQLNVIWVLSHQQYLLFKLFDFLLEVSDIQLTEWVFGRHPQLFILKHVDEVGGHTSFPNLTRQVVSNTHLQEAGQRFSLLWFLAGLQIQLIGIVTKCLCQSILKQWLLHGLSLLGQVKVKRLRHKLAIN